MSIDWIETAIGAAIGYGFGSIPFGLVLVRLAGLGDIRGIGSGNIGATNVLRTGRRDLAFVTFALDAGKGAIALFAASHFLGRDAGIAAAGAAFLGHCYPVWLRFKGGKGVSTFFGSLLAAFWPVGFMAGATWIAVAIAFRFSSLAALVAAACAPVYAMLLNAEPLVTGLCGFFAALVFLRHAPNIARLLKGQEPKIGAQKAQAETSDQAP